MTVIAPIENGEAGLTVRTKINELIFRQNQLNLPVSQEAGGTGATSLSEGLVTTIGSATTARTLADKLGDAVDARDHTTLAEAAARALAAGERVVAVRDDVASPPTIAERSNVVFRGEGRITGTNVDGPAYRRQVIGSLAPAAVAAVDSWPVRIASRAEPRIVLVGDSLSTYAADALTGADTFAAHLRARLRADNPQQPLQFWSRAIGGQRFDQLDNLPVVGYAIAERYPWYDDADRPWLDYVADLNPDLVILAFGMNDQAAFNRAALESVVAKINAFPTRPAIAFATNIAPNLAPHPDNSSFGTYAGQEGRDYAAGWVRTYALRNGHGLIDLNRTFSMMRDGRDILATEFVEHTAATFADPAEYLAPVERACRDFGLIATVAAAAWTNPQPFAVRLSSGTNNVVFMDNNGGVIRLRFYRGDTDSLYLTLNTTIPTPVTDAIVEITVRGGVFTFRVIPGGTGEQAGVEPVAVQVIRYGGLLRPRLYYFGGAPGSGPCLSVRLMQGVETQVAPTLTDLDLWGVPTSGTGTPRFGTGGNGVNHVTSRGAAMLYAAHFARQRYPLGNGYIAPFGLGQTMLAVIDGTDAVGFGNVVDGARLLPTNLAGGTGTPPAALIGTTWRCLGRTSGTTAPERTTLWERVS